MRLQVRVSGEDLSLVLPGEDGPVRQPVLEADVGGLALTDDGLYPLIETELQI